MSKGVLVIGAGGLGCATAFALGAAGVPRLTVCDDDVVDESNLHRQILHRKERVGGAKTASLKAEMSQRFPRTIVENFNHRFNAETAAGLVAGHDVVVDGSDNLGTKFLCNDAAVLGRKPLVHAAAVGVVGQLVSVPAGGRPCYRCLFEELPPPYAEAPSCAEAGVLGPVPGVLGALQAAEALRFLRGEPGAFVGRLLTYDAVAFQLRAVKFRPNPACRVCGPAADIHRLEDGGERCAS